MPAKNREHHRGTHQRRAKAVRDMAAANPSTRCWRCGRTQAEHRRKWQAGHAPGQDGMVGGLLLAECEPCNTSAGAKLGNRRRVGLVTSRDW